VLVECMALSRDVNAAISTLETGSPCSLGFRCPDECITPRGRGVASQSLLVGDHEASAVSGCIQANNGARAFQCSLSSDAWIAANACVSAVAEFGGSALVVIRGTVR
jgi:hypothetical protein